MVAGRIEGGLRGESPAHQHGLVCREGLIASRRGGNCVTPGAARAADVELKGYAI